MRVHLDLWYKNAGGVRLPPGDHEVSQELGEYLVAAGAARLIDEPPEKPKPPANKRRGRPPANKQR